MPKVGQEHYAQKRQEILAAARRVCAVKPLYAITMKEIVTESGMSQGGVYKYFPNIDALYAAILNEATPTGQVQADIEAILAAPGTPGERLTALLRYLGPFMERTVSGNGRLYLELMALYSQEPARFQAVREQLDQVPVLQFLQQHLTEQVLTGVASGHFRPVLPPDQIFAFVMTSVNGIVIALLTADRARIAGPFDLAAQPPAPDAVRLVEALTLSVRMLLGDPPN